MLEDGNLLIGCNTEKQVDKARKVQSVRKVKVVKTVKVGEQRSYGGKGVITRVPISVSMSELIENLKVLNSPIKNDKKS